MKKYRVLFFILIIVMSCVVFSACADNTDAALPGGETPDDGNTGDDVGGDGREEDGTLLMIYMCGSDLESSYGFASKNLEETASASLGENNGVIVQTGGSKSWTDSTVSANATSRIYFGSDGKEVVYEGPMANMGASDSLKAFVTFCEENYPDRKKSLILWDHGGTALNGVCFDENFDNDSLTLSEIAEALSGAEKLEFLGFDACLMGSVEVLAKVKDFADYIVFSQEIEPGEGWDYKTLCSLYGTVDTETFLNNLLTSYYAKYERSSKSEQITLSYVRTEYADALLEAFDELFTELSFIVEEEGLINSVRASGNAYSFGGRTEKEQYTNTIDLLGYLNGLTLLPEASAKVKAALNDCVGGTVNGTLKENAGGLSFYYPYIYNEGELQKYLDNYASGGYTTFLNAHYNDLSKYVIEMDNYGYEDENGAFTIEISENSVKYVRSVSYYLVDIQMFDDRPAEGNFFGKDVDIHNDATGVYSSNFKGRWVYMNGQPLEVYYIDSESKELHIFSGRIMVNGEPVNMRFSYNSVTAEMNVQGIWKGGLEDGQYSRLTSLNKGDIVQPIYEYIVEKDGIYFNLGEEFVYGEDTSLEIMPLKSTLYMYYMEVEDIFGRTYQSNTAVFQMKYSYEELLENPLTGKYDFAADLILIAAG